MVWGCGLVSGVGLRTASGRTTPLVGADVGPPGRAQPPPLPREQAPGGDENGPPANQELFKWLNAHKHLGHRLCEYKVHHPRACRGYAFQTDRGLVIARIADKSESDQELNDTMKSVKMLSGAFLEGGEIYE